MSDAGGDVGVAEPRALLATWANDSDEWVRRVVRSVLLNGKVCTEKELDDAYQLFRQEKQLDPRDVASEPKIILGDAVADRDEDLLVDSIGAVAGVNALVTGSEIELNKGLTILFGENGTGKTGYARILKALANSRTADDILADINSTSPPSHPSATIQYHLGDTASTLEWTGTRGVAPFTRMAVFDSPAVNFHIDDDLSYVYTPASLALFNHVSVGIQAVQSRLEAHVRGLRTNQTALLARFDRRSTLYPTIETLGASTDLEKLRALSEVPDDAEEAISALRLTVAALQSNTLGQQVSILQRHQRCLTEAAAYARLVSTFDPDQFDRNLAQLTTLRTDYQAYREALFVAARLPGESEETWEEFIRSGDAYARHLRETGEGDEHTCPYCRQDLSPVATELLGRYRDYLEDKIAAEISATEEELEQATRGLMALSLEETRTAVAERSDRPDPDGSVARHRAFIARRLLDTLRGALEI